MKYSDLFIGVYAGVKFEHTLVLIVVPIVGILFWLRVAKLLTPLLKEVKWFIYMGKNTRPIMIHHMFVVFLMQTVIYVIQKYTSAFSSFDAGRYKSEIYYLWAPRSGMNLIYTVVSIGTVLLVVYLGDRLKSKINIHRKSVK